MRASGKTEHVIMIYSFGLCGWHVIVLAEDIVILLGNILLFFKAFFFNSKFDQVDETMVNA